MHHSNDAFTAPFCKIFYQNRRSLSIGNSLLIGLNYIFVYFVQKSELFCLEHHYKIYHLMIEFNRSRFTNILLTKSTLYITIIVSENILSRRFHNEHKRASAWARRM